MIHTKFLGANNLRTIWEGPCPPLTRGMRVKVEQNASWGTTEEQMMVWEAYISIAGSDIPHQVVYLDTVKSVEDSIRAERAVQPLR